MIPYLRMVNLQKTIRYPTGHTYIAHNYIHESNYPHPPDDSPVKIIENAPQI